jgi:phenylacetic acid degradation operon negative regulatory protein
MSTVVRTKRQLDDPRTLGEPVKGAVIFAFGMLGPDQAAIPGPLLVEILGALGFAEPTARATILRMRRDGRLTSTRRGPVVHYELTPESRALSAAVLRPVMGERPVWGGGFDALLYTVPERYRAYRDSLRRTAVATGFGLFQPGILVTADPAGWTRIEPTVDAAPAGCRLVHAEIRLPLDVARVAASEAWPLVDLAGRYRAHVAELQRVTAACRIERPDGPDALRVMFEAMTPLFATAAEDPDLPVALLPDDWPGPGMQAAVVELSMALVPTIRTQFAGRLPDPAEREGFPVIEPA